MPVTRWSGINLLQPNRIVGYVGILTVLLRMLPSGILYTAAECGRVIRIGNRSSDAGQGRDSLGESDESRNVRCLRTELQELPACSGMGSRVPVSVVGVDSRSAGTPRKVEKGDGQLAPLEAISSLATQLLRTAQEGRRMDGKDSFGGEVYPLSAIISHVAGTWHGKWPLGEGVGECVYLVWKLGAWGEPMFPSGHFFSISATGVVGGC